MLIYEEKPKLQDSISVLRSIINYDCLIINSERCKNTLREFASYRYPSEDEKLSAKDDVPLKENDDTMDETRYAITFYESHFVKRYL